MLTPLWWLWYGLAFLLSQSWALAVFIAVLSTVFLAVRQWRGQNSYRVRPRGGGRGGTGRSAKYTLHHERALERGRSALARAT